MSGDGAHRDCERENAHLREAAEYWRDRAEGLSSVLTRYREALEQIAKEQEIYETWADGTTRRTCRYCETWLDENEEHLSYCPTHIAREALGGEA